MENIQTVGELVAALGKFHADTPVFIEQWIESDPGDSRGGWTDQCSLRVKVEKLSDSTYVVIAAG